MVMIVAADGIKEIVASPYIGSQALTGKAENGKLSEQIDEKSGLLRRDLLVERIPVEIIRGGEVSAFLPFQACDPVTIKETA